jgi:octaheme c-type cytochrome (tetrathionate reductase family)
MRTWKVRLILLASFAVGLLLAAQVLAADQPDMERPAEEQAPGRAMAQQAVKEPAGHWTTIKHGDLEDLKKDFENTPEKVTETCLSCHNQADDQIKETIHWTWICPKTGDGEVGKGGLVANNFCISMPSNEPRCTSCHIGYGWKDKTFDHTDSNKIDCLVCHEQTGTYVKFPTGAGYPPEKDKVFKGNGKLYKAPDYNKVAQSVSMPGRTNCGTCHFFGGGGNGVKHGDLDSSLANPSKELDVHMSPDGEDFSCTRCHTTKDHLVAGRCYRAPATEKLQSLLEADLGSRIACESCHTATPHSGGHKANDHTDTVACQSCHIPTYARKLPTKMYWDWRGAGTKMDGKKVVKEEIGDSGVKRATHHIKKGDFVWDYDVVPEYRWYNGSMTYTLLTDKIDDSGMVTLQEPIGSPGDERSRIMPFKFHRGMTPYDKGNKTMALPDLFKGPKAYWGNWDWNEALESGMSYVGLEFSGEAGFVETEYAYPITHMVAPKDNVVNCIECHSKGSRLTGVPGVYMPGRDTYDATTMGGWGLVILTLAGVVVHGIGRLFSRKEG